MTTHDIKGEVYEIERLNGCTEVIVNEGYREASYVLDEALIRFGGALDDGEYALAVSILEPLEVTPEVCGPCFQKLLALRNYHSVPGTIPTSFIVSFFNGVFIVHLVLTRRRVTADCFVLPCND